MVGGVQSELKKKVIAASLGIWVDSGMGRASLGFLPAAGGLMMSFSLTRQSVRHQVSDSNYTILKGSNAHKVNVLGKLYDEGWEKKEENETKIIMRHWINMGREKKAAP